MKPLEWMLDLLYPPKCAFCRKLLRSNERGCCTECEKTLPYYDEPLQGGYFAFCAAPLSYRDTVREAIHRYKFQGMDHYAAAFSQFICDSIAYHRMEADVLAWVPVSRKRRKQRGYDQAELLCRAVAKKMGKPCMQLLQKTRDNPAQSGLQKDARRVNVLGVYQAKNTEMISGKRILLIDDVITTASTLSECSRVLLTAGAQGVWCAALACAAGSNEEKQV